MERGLVVLGVVLVLMLACGGDLVKADEGIGHAKKGGIGDARKGAIGMVYRFMCQIFRCKAPEVPTSVRSGGDHQEIPEYAEVPPSTSEAVYKFGHNMLKEYRVLNPTSNVVFSPASIVAALSLVYFGSAGATKELMESTLGFQKGIVPTALAGKDSNKLHNSKVISVANKAFFAEEHVIKEDFQELVGQRNVESVPFTNDPESAKDTINEFVSENTKGLIPEVVSGQEINSRTEIVLVNAIYFKGDWKYKFPEKGTKKAEFKGVDGPTMVDFMTFPDGMELRTAEDEELDSMVVELPYDGDHQFAMYIILPNTEGGWKDVEKKLAESKSMSFVENLRYNSDIQLSMPKWDLETDMTDATHILEKMGLSSLFRESPDFSAMIEGGSFPLSDVIHKAKIKVSEEVGDRYYLDAQVALESNSQALATRQHLYLTQTGTVAAASTAVISTRSAVFFDYEEITVDRPFLYYVVDGTDNTIFFQGTITKLQ